MQVVIQRKGDAALKVTTMDLLDDGSAKTGTERLVLNGEPHEFSMPPRTFLVISEAPTAGEEVTEDQESTMAPTPSQKSTAEIQAELAAKGPTAKPE